MLPGKKGGNREEMAVLGAPRRMLPIPPLHFLLTSKAELHYHSPPESTVWALSCGIKKQRASATVPRFVCPGEGLTEAAGRVNGPVDVQAGSSVLHAPVAGAARQRAVPQELCCLHTVCRDPRLLCG